MAKHSKQRIEKDNFHDYIFNVCRRRISMTNLASNDVRDLKEILSITANIIAREEHAIIESYNFDGKEAINIALYNTIDELNNLLYASDDHGITSFLKKTYKFIKPIDEKLRKLTNNQRDVENYSLIEKYPKVQLTVGKAFLTYYKIVSLIVEDINEMPGWKEISEYYKQKYEINNPVHIKENKPLTFLSYAFKDNIYALFLFDLFENNGGFLYVDSLFGTDFGKEGSKIKNALSPWIDSASQILFLHSIHSDKVKKGLSSWCSWELGEAYKSNNDKPKGFFKVVVAGIRKEDTHPIIDHQFKELDKVVHGIIIPK